MKMKMVTHASSFILGKTIHTQIGIYCPILFLVIGLEWCLTINSITLKFVIKVKTNQLFYLFMLVHSLMLDFVFNH